jgi:hypothetical protein
MSWPLFNTRTRAGELGFGVDHDSELTLFFVRMRRGGWMHLALEAEG